LGNCSSRAASRSESANTRRDGRDEPDVPRALRDVLESRDLSALQPLTNSSRFQQQFHVSSTGFESKPQSLSIHHHHVICVTETVSLTRRKQRQTDSGLTTNNTNCPYGSLDSTVTRLRVGRPWFDSRQEQGLFLLATVSRPALGRTQPPNQWNPVTDQQVHLTPETNVVTGQVQCVSSHH